MPARPRSHTLEDLSRNRLHQAFEHEGWTVENLVKDYGEDLLVRLFEDGKTTPYSFFVQAKAVSNTAKCTRQKGTTISVRVASGHVRHWLRFTEPVLLTLWDAASDITYWVCVQDEIQKLGKRLDEALRGRSVQVTLPVRNTLSADGLKRIRGITKLRFGRLTRQEEIIETLVEALKKEGITVEDHDPDTEGISLNYPDGSAMVVLYGRTAREYDYVCKRLKVSHEELKRRILDDFAKRINDRTDTFFDLKKWLLEDELERQREAADH